MSTKTINPKDPLNPTLEEAAGNISGLVRDFGANAKYYLSTSYQEAEVRKDFIDKFLIALGWDVNHEIQKNPFQQEVKVERNVQMATAQRRADYAFALQPHFDSPVLYIEAKKPCGDIATPDNYFQIIRYANQRGHAIGILTDFDQLHVIDCRFQANIDTAIHRHLEKYHFTEYIDPEKFARIFFLFSRPAVADGSIEKYTETLPKPKGRPGQKAFFPIAYRAIDELLLNTLDELRGSLARGLKNQNSQLDSLTLTEITQRILDRLVFIRFLEDKLIEPAPIIPKLGESSGRTAWQDFLAISRRLDKTYNGIVFKYHSIIDDPDGLDIEEKVFTDILDAFDYHKSKYLFNDIPLHILGSIYERFLGNVIVATSKRAKLDLKPEVRKAGGVYYTPKYIVDYIVQNTVGKLIEDKSPDEITNMRFADIACGSGSFLLGVYDYLLKYITLWYNNHSSKTPKGAVIKRDGIFHLSLEEKGRILTDNIYGVDIDQQAVEVSQLSLYLKLLEEETTASARQYVLDFHRPLLPSLSENIKCGNSLIGHDFYNNRQQDFLDPDSTRNVNAFDWHVEFKQIIDAGGFDAIVGNPPYVRMETFKAVKEYLRMKYSTHEERSDLYAYFIERGLSLLSNKGLLGLIVSNKFVRAKYGEPLRRFLAQSSSIKSIFDFAGANVFKGATVRTLVLIASPYNEKAPAPKYAPVPSPTEVAAFELGTSTVSTYAMMRSFSLTENALSTNEWNLTRCEVSLLLNIMRARGTQISEYIAAHALYGIKTGCNEAFVVESKEANKLIAEHKSSVSGLRPILFGKDIRRYSISYAGRRVVYLHPDKDIYDYPALLRHLETFKQTLRARAGSQKWYELQQPAVALLPYGNKPKIIYPIISNECRFTLDQDGYLINDKAFILPTDDLALLGVLNSNIGFFYFSNVCAALEGKTDRYLEFRAQYVDKFPVPRNLNKKSPQYKNVVSLVNTILGLYKEIQYTNTDHARTLVQRQIDAIDRQINQIVYELYSLTEAEIKIVEETNEKPSNQDIRAHKQTPRQQQLVTDKPSKPDIRTAKKVRRMKPKRTANQGEMFD